MGAICALLLTGVARFTAPYREANAKAEKVRNVLGVLGVTVDEMASAAELVSIFEKDVEQGTKGSLDYYKSVGKSGSQVLAFPFSGRGLWGPVKGFLSLEADMRTIKRVSFYEQEETPGLGGEIGSPWFRKQFEGKSIVGEDGSPGIRIIRGGGASRLNEIDAISGATMTCDRVQAMLNTLCQRIITEWKENG